MSVPALVLALTFSVAAGKDVPDPSDELGPALQPTGYRDGHVRPRALSFNGDDGLLYVALSTSDEVAVVDPRAGAPRVLNRIPSCRFPNALAPLPGGGALVACRFDPGLRAIERADGGRWRVRSLDAGPESGGRALALAPGGEVAYLSSPPVAGVKVVSLAAGGVLQTMATGLSPRALRVVPAGTLPGWRVPLLLVANFIEHTVSIHPIDARGRLGAPVQTVATEAPVLDLLVVPGRQGRPAHLLLFTHEDRALSRAQGPVEGLDSGILVFAAADLPKRPGKVSARGPASDRPPSPPFWDPGPGRRTFLNLGERSAPVIELAAAAASDGWLAVVGAGTDNLMVARDDGRDALTARAPAVGTHPSAVAALPGGRFVTADRLSDTLTFVRARAGGPPEVETLNLGLGERPTAAERGELLFYGRALVPRNVADGPLSLYTCAACHDDGQVDGRRHPAKRNRFFSMTKSCQGLGTTAPYLSLGQPETIAAFADNIVATHAQGADRDPDGFDRYPVTLRVRRAGEWGEVVLSPEEVRAALAAYMTLLPPEPSPFVPAERGRLEAEERRGLEIFRNGCTGCHQLVGNSALGNRIGDEALERRLLAGEVALTSPRRHRVGTPVLGEEGNNPPSLRGVWSAAPYFSDGSARTLEEVLRRTDPDAELAHAPENAARPPAFTRDETAALLAFLRAL